MEHQDSNVNREVVLYEVSLNGQYLLNWCITQSIRMGILIWYLVGCKTIHIYIWFLYTTGLLKHQIPQKNKKRSKIFLKAKRKVQTPKFKKKIP